MLSAALYIASCTNDSPSVVGGWYDNRDQYACFMSDHRAGFGDHVNETLALKSTWSDEGRINFKTNVNGTWKILADGSLEVFVENCTVDCDTNPVKYRRDTSFGCPG